MALKGESDIIRPVPTPAPFVETSPGRFINPRVLERNAPTPTAMPTPKVMGVSDQQPMKAGNRQDKESLVRQGFSQWSNVPENELESKLPVTKYIPEMIAISEEYGIPEWILPVFSILETSGGQNVKDPNNPFNWGIRSGYKPKDIEEVMRKMAYSFSQRPDAGLDYSERYQIPLREGNYQKFFEGYEPPEQNPNYWKDAQNVMNYFR